jgi:amino acid transporter
MKQGNKFGTFGGVFTPSILTILGVIMYLRLPWLVGNAGLLMVIGIILVAHLISVTTGLSVASIATDKRVRAGGPYYIVSRSLGLPIGGTLGIALFVGLSFSVSLYIIGFSESFLSVIEIEATRDNIRICGSVTLVLVTVVTLISTAFAIKLQYVIMGFIVLSLISILGGDPSLAPSEPAIQPALTGDVSMAVLFGIFFPAVTGFTAGVNMSGDLKDPKKALPQGTILAIGVGLVIYLALAAFLAFRVDREQLIGNPSILLDMSLYAPFVVAGIWGATLSSALGSILGAPRILQATSVDRITPKIFSKGHGRTNEPRNPLILTFGIAEIGILIGELDAIAAIVSMFFITTYGLLNLSCAIESWANPDFRPEFKIPTLVPVVGTVTCVLMMIQLDFFAMIAAITLLAGIFVIIKRRQLQLESGDTWQGVWSSLVRSGLHRLNRGANQQRHWRPNILAFTSRREEDRAGLVEFGAALVGAGGVLTDFELIDDRKRLLVEEVEPSVGVFHRLTPCEKPFETMEAICRYHGFSGIEPNTVLIPLQKRVGAETDFDAFLRCTENSAFNTLMWRSAPEGIAERPEVIDIWWRPEAGRLRFALILTRFLQATSVWRDASLRFIIVHRDVSRVDGMQKRLSRLMDEQRINAEVKFIDSELHDRSFMDLVRQESSATDLTFLGLPDAEQRRREGSFEELAALGDAVKTLVVYRSAKNFEPLFDDVRNITTTMNVSELTPSPDFEPITLPTLGSLAADVRSFADQHEALFRDIHDRSLQAHGGLELALITDLEAVLSRSFSHLEKAMSGASKRRQRKLVSRAQSSFLYQSRQLLQRFEHQELTDQRDALNEAIETHARLSTELIQQFGGVRSVSVARSAFAPTVDDTPDVRRFKRRKRLAALLQGETIRVDVPIGALVDYHLNQESLDILHRVLCACASRSLEFANEVRRLIQSTHHTLALLDKRVDAGDVCVELIAQDRATLSEEFLSAIQLSRDNLKVQLHLLLKGNHAVTQQLAFDLEDFSVISSVRKTRRVSPRLLRLRREIMDAPASFFTSQLLLLKRTELELQMVALHLRLTTIVERAEAGLSLRLQNSILAPYEQFVSSLDELNGALTETKAKDLRFYRDHRQSFEARVVFDELLREFHAATAELPDTIEVIDDESVGILEGRPFSETAPVSVGLRRMVETLVERELLGGLQEILAEIELTDQSSQSVVAEVLRLVAFNLGDFEGSEDESMDDLMGPVVTNGLERCQAQYQELKLISTDLNSKMEGQLQRVRERTNSYAILREVQRPTTSRSSVQLFPTFTRSLSRVQRSIRHGLTHLRYRRRSAMLAAWKLTEKRPTAETVVDRMLVHTHLHAPTPEVSEGLPFYYRQLFLGRSTVSSDFWVGRSEEVAQGIRAIENNREGYRGALVVTGAGMSGKSAYCRHLTRKMFDKSRSYHVFPPRSGSVDIERFKQSLRDALEVQGELGDIFQSVKEQSAIVLHDLELWWSRSEDGLDVIKLVLRLIEDYGHRTLFVLNMNTYAFRFISKVLPLADHALSVVNCGPLSAEELKDVILLRHRSTGHRFRLDNKIEEQLSEWALARIFTGAFDYSMGNVGVALQAWVSHAESVQRSTIALRLPRATNLDLFDELRMEWIAILIQFVLHKRLTRERLLTITRASEPSLAVAVNTLIRMGIVTESSAGVLELNRFVAHMVTTHLEERGLLP